VSLFDIIAIALLAVSAIVGLARGALREVATVAALIAAGIAAIYSLRYVGPLARQAIHPAWLADIGAILIIFLAVYITLRVLSSALIRRVHDTRGLGGLDRLAGGGLGLARGLIVLGVLDLGIHLAPPAMGVPSWITQARLFPLAEKCGEAVRAAVPKGSQIAHRLTPEIEKVVKTGQGEPISRSGGGSSDDNDLDRARKGLDDVAEKTR
jgi:membrane protein required for colicin V production